jgi:hypothetical protein
LGHQNNSFLKAFTIKSMLAVQYKCVEQMIFKFSACLVQEKNKYKDAAYFFENPYLIYRMFRELHHISVQAFLRSHWSIFSRVHQWLGFGSQTTFGTYLRVTGGFRKAGTSFLKRATGKILTIVIS